MSTPSLQSLFGIFGGAELPSSGGEGDLTLEQSPWVRLREGCCCRRSVLVIGTHSTLVSVLSLPLLLLLLEAATMLRICAILLKEPRWLLSVSRLERLPSFGSFGELYFLLFWSGDTFQNTRIINFKWCNFLIFTIRLIKLPVSWNKITSNHDRIQSPLPLHTDANPLCLSAYR